MDVFELSNFPFVNSAQQYVENLDFKLDELFSERAFEGIRERGKNRVIEAITEGIIKHEVSDKNSAKKELLSYPVARILISCINDGFLVRRYAMAEAKSAFERIKKLSMTSLKDMASDFDILSKIDEQLFLVHFTGYIRYAVHEPKWKLVNRKLDRGWVYLSKEEFARIIEEAIRIRIDSSLPVEVPREICEMLNNYLGEIRTQLDTQKSEFSIDEFKEIMPDSFPPCIVYAISNVKSGVNLSHSMRFALTSFLLNIGMDAEGIIDMFRISPDFDEERTRYQVMHIFGATGTMYKSPSCSTMLTYGNCTGREPLCDRISHPLGYYRKKGWFLKKEKTMKSSKSDESN